MNTSYLGAEWYIDETENQSQRCARRPLHVAAQQIHLHQRHAAHRQHRGPSAGTERGHRLHPQRRSAYQTTIWAMDSLVDYLPNNRFALPVNKDNAIASGIVKEVRPRPDGRYDLPGTAQTDDRQERDDAARHAGPFRLEASDPLHTGLHVCSRSGCSTTSSSTATPTAWCRSTPPMQDRCTRSAASIRTT